MPTEEFKVKVTVEGDSSRFSAAADRAKASADGFAEAAKRASSGVVDFKAATDKAGGPARNLGDALLFLAEKNKNAGAASGATSRSLAGLAQAATKGLGPLQGMTRQMGSMKFEAANLGHGVTDIIKAFGPWGAAIGIAGDALISFVGHMDAADAKAREFAKKRADELKDAQVERRKAFVDLENERKVEAQTAPIDAMIHALEREKVAAEASEKSVAGLTREISRLNAARIRATKVSTFGLGEDEQTKRLAEIEGDARAVERAQELADIAERFKKPKEKKGKKGKTKKEIEEEKAAEVFAQQLAEASNARAFESPQISRDSADVLAAQEQARQAAISDALRRQTQGGDRGALEAELARIEDDRVRQLGESIGPTSHKEARSLSRADRRRNRNGAPAKTSHADRASEFFGVAPQEEHEAELARIEEMRTAKMTFLQEELAASAASDEQAAIREEMRQTNHEAQLARISEEIAAQQEQAARVQQFTAMGAAAANTAVGGILAVTDARRGAILAAKAQGKTDREAARAGKIAALEATAGQLQALRNLAISKAIEQTALGIGALAVFNYPSAGMHFAAAATWGAVGVGAGLGARGIASRVSGMQRADGQAANSAGQGAGSGAGSGSGGGGSSANDSPIPGSPRSGPGPQAPTSGGGSRGGNTTVNLNINGDVVGTPRREFVRELDQQLNELGQSRRRRAGGE